MITAKTTAKPSLVKEVRNTVQPAVTPSPIPKGRSIAANKAVRVYDPRMGEGWNYETQLTSDPSTWYWKRLNKEAMRQSFDFGLKKLTGASTVEEAWLALLPNYNTTQKILIKGNMNCLSVSVLVPNTSVAMLGVIVDSLHENLGHPHENICIADYRRKWISSGATGAIKITQAWCQAYPGSTPVDGSPTNTTSVEIVHCPTSHQNDREYDDPLLANITGGWYFDELIDFGPIYPKIVGNRLAQADHIINVSLAKGHRGYITGALKNHYGSVNYTNAIHGVSGYNRDRCIARLPAHHLIRDKERLCVCEAVYMQPYGEAWLYIHLNEPNFYPTGRMDSLVFTVNPVVMDRMLHDFLNKEALYSQEGQIPSGYDYLTFATTEFANEYNNVSAAPPDSEITTSFGLRDFHYANYDYMTYQYEEEAEPVPPKPPEIPPDFSYFLDDFIVP